MLDNNNLEDNLIISPSGRVFFKVVERPEKYFSLEKYIVCYDEEEGAEYTVRQKPDPAGRYKTVEMAINEGRRLLE